ncbi:MAG: hypothetical protein ACK4MS_01805 [Paracoccaceae bacterium]
MTEEEKIQRLNELADRLFSWMEPSYAGRDKPPFDIKPVNLHHSKKEFTDELRTVAAIVGHLHGVLVELQITPETADPSKDAMISRIQAAVDNSIRQNVRRKKLTGATANDLVTQNFRDTGFFTNSNDMLSDMIFAYNQRLDELRDQEKEFWNVPNRAPDYFARTIALRFARLFARQKGKRPTFGTSRDGGHPSTVFGRALEEVFEVLEIATHIRGSAVWAIEQLTEDDCQGDPYMLGAPPRKVDPLVQEKTAALSKKGS